MFIVASYCQIVDQLSLIDSSRKLVSIYIINFIINLYLILYKYIQTSNSMKQRLQNLELEPITHQARRRMGSSIGEEETEAAPARRQLWARGGPTLGARLQAGPRL